MGMILVDVVRNKQEQALLTFEMRLESCGLSEHRDAIVATGVAADCCLFSRARCRISISDVVAVTVLTATVVVEPGSV